MHNGFDIPAHTAIMRELLRLNPGDASAVRNGLIWFDASLKQYRDAVAKRNDEHHAARDIAYAVTNYYQTRFDQLNATPDQICKMANAVAAMQATAAALDELDNSPDYTAPSYHHNPHNILVMGTRLMMYRYDYPAQKLTPEIIINIIHNETITMVHDILHNGRTNRRLLNRTPDLYHPAWLEMQSYRRLEPILREHRFLPDEINRAQWMLIPTDPGLPGEIAKYGHALHHDACLPVQPWHELEKQVADSPAETQDYMRQFMNAIREDKTLARDALALKAADMSPAFGLQAAFGHHLALDLNLEYERCGARQILNEQGNPDPPGQLFAMINFIGVRISNQGPCLSFLAPAADELYGPVLGDIAVSMINHVLTSPDGEKQMKKIWQDFRAGKVLINEAGREICISEGAANDDLAWRALLKTSTDLACRRHTQPRPSTPSP
ncbi:MAG: hypothetical protein SFW62_03420 [Alphaproteobacteria bacterium]|nr:hypothetical protein [Alphaproteobacteria bacterium]